MTVIPESTTKSGLSGIQWHLNIKLDKSFNAEGRRTAIYWLHHRGRLLNPEPGFKPININAMFFLPQMAYAV
jgi:hypothetical protein